MVVVMYIGRCKGYGFVEYAHNHEKSELARRQLDGMKVSGSVLRCQFVPLSLVRFTDLQSRCLLVTNIPRDLSTTATLCSVLSVVSTPAFCQVVTTILVFWTRKAGPQKDTLLVLLVLLISSLRVQKSLRLS